jgi:hypothetical protein
VRQVLMAQAKLVRDVLLRSDGTLGNGATLTNGAWVPSSDPTRVESQGAGVRVLTEAWFLTHDTSYHDAARKAARALLTAFWSDPARMFRAEAGGADDIVMTPERFGWLQQALRETYEALWIPGDALLDRGVLEDRVGRTNALFLNGWDDLNGDQAVDTKTECLDAGLQLGEQALTGEIGTTNNGVLEQSAPDHDQDCVLNIAAANVASTLAAQVHFHSP